MPGAAAAATSHEPAIIPRYQSDAEPSARPDHVRPNSCSKLNYRPSEVQRPAESQIACLCTEWTTARVTSLERKGMKVRGEEEGVENERAGEHEVVEEWKLADLVA